MLPRVPVAERPSDADLRSLVGAERPVVLRGCTDEWPARAWTLPSLCSLLGDLRTTVRFHPVAAGHGASFARAPALESQCLRVAASLAEFGSWCKGEASESSPLAKVPRDSWFVPPARARSARERARCVGSGIVTTRRSLCFVQMIPRCLMPSAVRPGGRDSPLRLPPAVSHAMRLCETAGTLRCGSALLVLTLLATMTATV